MNYKNHIPVFKNEVLDLLNIKPNGIYIDCTFGRGGHAFSIAKLLSEKGKVICFDKDYEAIEFFKNNNHLTNIFIEKVSFAKLANILKQKYNIEKVDGILYDLGVSSPQIDNQDRGFSYIKSGPLDMRMDQSQKLTAKLILETYSYQDLVKIFKLYGDIKKPQALVKKILYYRLDNNFNTTDDFKKIITQAIPLSQLHNANKWYKRCFQAIRIEVNNEINDLSCSLQHALQLLNHKARIVVITFHSLEDRIVKNIFNAEIKKNVLPLEIPLINYQQKFNIINTKSITPKFEKTFNPRAKSAKIRCIERY